VSVPLAVLEDITGNSGVALRIQALLPVSVRRRQLTIRTLLPACSSPWPTTGPRT